MAKFTVDSFSDGMVTLRVPGKNYRNSFKLAPSSSPPSSPAKTLAPGESIRGTIHAPAWKAENVSAGGNYVEPLYGRPRRMQGTILAANAATNELTVDVAYPVTVKLPDKYKTANFPVGTRIGWDNVDVPTFEPMP